MIGDQRLAEIESDLRAFVRTAYPEMIVRAERLAQDPSRITLFFIEGRFEGLYPRQRYHYLTHLIPEEYCNSNLADTVWFELTPGQTPEEIEDDPGDDYIAEIAPEVMATLQAIGFFDSLDEMFSTADGTRAPKACSGDFSGAKLVLSRSGIEEFDWSDVFHVLMGRGAFCDCEILLNAAPESRMRSQYWRRVHES